MELNKDVYSLRGLRGCLRMLKIKERDSVIPVTQEFSYYNGGVLRRGNVISEEDYPVFFKELVDSVIKVNNDGGDVEEYLKDIKKRVRMSQRLWSQVFCDERGRIVRDNTGVSKPSCVHGYVNEQRVPFDIVMYVCFDKEKRGSDDGEKVIEGDRSFVSFIKNMDRRWMVDKGLVDDVEGEWDDFYDEDGNIQRSVFR